MWVFECRYCKRGVDALGLHLLGPWLLGFPIPRGSVCRWPHCGAVFDFGGVHRTAPLPQPSRQLVIREYVDPKTIADERLTVRTGDTGAR